MAARRIPLIKVGDKFNRWLVISLDHGTLKGNYWLCRCECGIERCVRYDHLRNGATKSCGCHASEVTAERNKESTTHGLSQTKEYRIWLGMIARCYDVKVRNFHNYGGRGITVCDRWRKSVAAFIEDMGTVPDGQSIERIDNNGNYEPGNCKWATGVEQGRNRRNNHIISYGGETMTLTEWALRTNIKLSTLLRRIDKLGWSVERALTAPVDTRQRSIVS